jgi:phosphomevalonate kinase
MNKNELEISRILTLFEETIEEHSNVLDDLENILSFPSLDQNKIEIITKKLRRIRNKIRKGIEVLMKNFNGIENNNLKEETLGILNYLYNIGLKDEIELLNKLKELCDKGDIKVEVEKDIIQLREFVDKLSHFSF